VILIDPDLEPRRPLPEQRVEPAAAEALELATRQHEAAQQKERNAVLDLVRGIGKHRATCLQEQQGVEQAIRDDLRKTLTTLSEQFYALTREGRVLATLRLFPEQGSLYAVNFGRPGRLDARAQENAEATVAKELANTQGNMSHSMIPRQTPYLLAELRRQIEEACTSAT
jgi:hypothetical protein